MRRWLARLWDWLLSDVCPPWPPSKPIEPAKYTEQLLQAFHRNQAFGANVTRDYPKDPA